LFVKAVLRGGHVGKGKYHEMVRYLVVNNLVEVLSVAQSIPRVKKNRLALISCTQISREEYLQGKLHEDRDPYLNTFKIKKLRGGESYEQTLHGKIA